MKKILLLITFYLLQSCNTSKEYQFVTIVDETDVHGNISRKENITIKELENDSIAAVDVFRSYCISRKLDHDYKEKNIKDYTETIDYKLLDKKGNIIKVSNFVSDKLKLKIEKEIFKDENIFDNIHKNDQIDIDSQFSKIDGHHIKLEEYIKSNLNDPTSYQHISSEFKVNKNNLEVALNYRAKNSFNALIKNRVIAECDLYTGEVIRIIK